MYTVGFNKSGTTILKDYYFSNAFYSRAILVLRTGPIPEEVPEFDLSTGYEDLNGFRSSMVDSLWKDSVACFRMNAAHKTDTDGNSYLELEHLPGFARSSYDWQPSNGRWERSYNVLKHVAGKERVGIQSLNCPADTMSLQLDETPIWSPSSLTGTQEEFELTTDRALTVDGVNVKVASSTPVFLDAWVDGDWQEVGDLGRTNVLVDIDFTNPITTDKWRIRTLPSNPNNSMLVKYFMFYSNTVPTFEAPKQVTHAYLLGGGPPNITGAEMPSVGKGAVLLTVGDINEDEPVTLISKQVGDNQPPEFLSCALRVEELDSDKV
tara:strand:+ start:872 stop:1837 length:966 start_codon:yes stop_codon:yes gene_type:complete